MINLKKWLDPFHCCFILFMLMIWWLHPAKPNQMCVFSPLLNHWQHEWTSVHERNVVLQNIFQNLLLLIDVLKRILPTGMMPSQSNTNPRSLPWNTAYSTLGDNTRSLLGWGFHCTMPYMKLSLKRYRMLYMLCYTT